MFFPSCGTSYLPLDSEQSIKFYKNENLSFPPLPPPPPPTVACIRNNTSTAMFPTENDSIPAGHDFRPVAHLSSNGYYGYLPLANNNNSVPKDVSTEVTTVSAVTTHPHTNTTEGQSNLCGGGSVLLDSQRQPAVDDSAMMMDSAGEMENYHHQQQQQLQNQPPQQLRKRKEYSDELELSCKRRKTWLEENQHHQQQQQARITDFHQPQMDEMDCHDHAMEEESSPCTGIETPVMMNGKSIGFNHLQPPFQSVANPLPQPMVVHQQQQQQQPKSKYIDFSRCMMSHMI